MHKIFFPQPEESKYLADLEGALLTDVETGTPEDKLSQFVGRCQISSATMPFNEALDGVIIPWTGVSLYEVVNGLEFVDAFSFIVALLNAFVMLINLEYHDDDPDKVHYHVGWFKELNRGLGIVQLVMCITVALVHLLKAFPFVVIKRFRAYLERDGLNLVPVSTTKETYKMLLVILPGLGMQILPMLLIGELIYERYESDALLIFAGAVFVPAFLLQVKKYCDVPESYGSLVFVTVSELLLDPTTLFNFFLIACCCLGLWRWEAFYSLVLFKVVTLSPAILNVVKAVYIPLKPLAMTFVLAIIFVFVFALWGFWFWRDTFMVDEVDHCQTLLECFLLFMHMGFLGGAGIPGDGILAEESFKYDDGSSVLKMLFDLAFWVIVTVCMLNCVFGIMLDTFAALREQNEETDDQLSNYCFICCLHRSEFNSQQEFVAHEEHQHNMLDYVSFITYVECTKETQRNGYQDYVHDMVLESDVSWLPVSKSMQLGKDGDEATLGSVSEAVTSVASNMESMMQMMGDMQSRLSSLEQASS